jgi:hypothetical protein
MSNLSKTIHDIVSQEMGQAGLRQTKGLTTEIKIALSKQEKHVAANDNKVTLEDLGFKKIVPAFIEGEYPKKGFVRNYAGDEFYAIPARPLKSFENLRSAWSSALKGVGYGALSTLCAGQTYASTQIAQGLQSTHPTLSTISYIGAGLGGLITVGAAVRTYERIKSAYLSATVDTLGVGIRIHKDYADFLERRKTEQEALQTIRGSNMKPVLFKA